MPNMYSFLRNAILPAAFLALAASHVSAQVRVTKRSCLFAKPLPACAAFWVTEFEAHFPLVSSGPENQSDDYLEHHVGGQIGWMKNRGSIARGMAITAGMSPAGPRLGILGRQRRWFGPTRTLDVAAGVIHTGMREPPSQHWGQSAYGITGDVSVGWRDVAHVLLRADLVRSEDVTATALYAGFKIGSRGGVVIGGIGAVAVTIGAIALTLGKR